MTTTGTPQPPYKQLRRPVTDRMVGGVASGVGRYFGVDPTLVRVIFAVTGLLTGGLALLAYPIMWFLMPEEPADAPAWPHPTATAPTPAAQQPTTAPPTPAAQQPTAAAPTAPEQPTTAPPTPAASWPAAIPEATTAPIPVPAPETRPAPQPPAA